MDIDALAQMLNDLAELGITESIAIVNVVEPDDEEGGIEEYILPGEHTAGTLRDVPRGERY